eukprot:scaffold846_cov252-Pinguiococcus_pyrenoidosus.AAC.32
MRLSDLKETTGRKLAAPVSIDWRDEGAVSPVKDQAGCGSCWTFSTTGAMESQHYLSTGEMLSLSEQQLGFAGLCACGRWERGVTTGADIGTAAQGCNGGLPSHAFQYIYYAGGIMGEESYPYTAKNGECVFDQKQVEAKVLRAFNITTMDEEELEQAVGIFGPVSVAFQVASDFKVSSSRRLSVAGQGLTLKHRPPFRVCFLPLVSQQYDSGVYSSDICQSGAQDVNHAVLAVGYDTTDDGMPYWIIKNSWGAQWGKRRASLCKSLSCLVQ